MKEYKGGDLKGLLTISRKIDGVQAIWGSDRKAYSRNGKPLHNLPEMHEGTRAEIYLGSFKDSISAVKTHNGTPVHLDNIFMLAPALDPRLRLLSTVDITEGELRVIFRHERDDKHEGLVIHFGDGREPLKMKDKLDTSVRIEGFLEGTGRNKGRLGAFITRQGKVGTGFTDLQRDGFWGDRDELLGEMIEVQFMEWTTEGKMRHPRFIRLRPDIS